MATFDLTIKCGEDWTATMTYSRAGVPTRVEGPVAEVRQGETSASQLVLRMDSTSIISQDADGVMAFRIPHEVTSALPAGSWYWDLFGTVAGNRKKLIDTSEVLIVSATTGDA